LGRVKAEEVLGEMALFLDTNKRMATAVATKDSILITILSFSILELSNKNPQLLEKIRAIIDNRIINNKVKEKKDF
jgi:CRP-like cAMP-binding protein